MRNPMCGSGWKWAVFLLLLTFATVASAAETQPLFGPKGVTPEAVKQGKLGSCYFHATLASLAQSHPDALRDAITTAPDGSYRVHFFDGPEELVYPEDLDFGRAHNFDHSDGAWVLVLMRGYAQRELRQSLVEAVEKSTLIPIFVKPMALSALHQSGPLLVAYDRAVRAVIDQDGNINKAQLKQKLSAQLSLVGVPSMQAEMLGGFLDQQGFFDSLAKTVEQNGETFGAYKSVGQGGIPLRVLDSFLGASEAGMVAEKAELVAHLRQLKSGGLEIVAGTYAKPPDASFNPADTEWFVASHSYSVLGFDEATQIVSLRNPWGTRPGPDGAFTLPLATFVQTFESYCYGKKK